MLISIAVEAVF